MDASLRRVLSDQLTAISHVTKASGDPWDCFLLVAALLPSPPTQYSQSIFLKIAVKQDGLAWSPSTRILQRTQATLCIVFVFG